MKRFPLLTAFLLVVSVLSGWGNADDRDDELFRLRLENAALRARIEAGIAELTRPIDQPAHPSTPSLANFASGRLELPKETPPLAPAVAPLPPEAQPTPLSDVHRALSLLDLNESDVLGDIGCGADARVLIEAARVYGCRGVGLEINADRAAAAKSAVEEAGLSHRIAIYNLDAANARWEFNKAYVYLWPETLSKLSSRLATLDKVVSFSHYVMGLSMAKHGDFYVWSQPASSQTQVYAAVTQPTYTAPTVPTASVATQQPAYVQQKSVTRSRQNVAYWGGQAYNRPLCSRGNCTMCNSIRSQLYGNTW